MHDRKELFERTAARVLALAEGANSATLGYLPECTCSVAFTRLGRKVLVEFPGLVPVGPGVLWHVLLDRDVRPLLRVFAIELDPLLKARLGVSLDSVDRALGHAHPAVDALIGVDDEHVLALVEAVDGTHRNAIGGLALDAPLIDDVVMVRSTCKLNH